MDWAEFLMDAPAQPFRADRFSGWYGYRDFSDGPVPGLASHFVDRNRGTCRAPIEAGLQHAVAVLMAVRAADTGRRQIYDAEKREIRAG